ncbi:MAG TPA: hypothetical protein VKP14_04635 [Gaiellaceae bacterium]|nr:hypothetical protein [Gaiellaceae bacterium]
MAAQRWVLTKQYTQSFPGVGVVNGWKCVLPVYEGNGVKALYRITLDGPPGVAGVDIYQGGGAWVATLALGNSIDVEADFIELVTTPSSPAENGEQLTGMYERL